VGLAASKPADRDKRLRGRSQDDDNDIGLDRKADFVTPDGSIGEAGIPE
jgi:hypothetical protein